MIEIPGTEYRLEKDLHWRDDGAGPDIMIWALLEAVVGKIDEKDFLWQRGRGMDENGGSVGFLRVWYTPLGISVTRTIE